MTGNPDGFDGLLNMRDGDNTMVQGGANTKKVHKAITCVEVRPFNWGDCMRKSQHRHMNLNQGAAGILVQGTTLK